MPEGQARTQYSETAKMREEYHKILVRATNWVGDAVMSVPALQALRLRYPDAHIAVLARPWVAGLYGREPFCDELIPYEAARAWSGLGDKWRLACELKTRNFDCAILLQNAFEAAAIAKLAGIPVRIGYDRDLRGWLLTNPIAVPKPGEILKHQRFYYLELLRRAEIIAEYNTTSSIQLAGAPRAAENGRELFRQAGLNGPVIGVSPGAAYGGAKRWLPERFAEAAALLAKERGASVATVGTKNEGGISEEVCANVTRAGVACVNFAGRTSLEELIDMAAACELFLTNDSGSMHIASALGVPTVAIFGATDDEATGPTGESRVVREPVECSPCLLRECPIDHRCMTRVSAERVAETARQLIGIQKLR